jgi:hypothetical protein
MAKSRRKENGAPQTTGDTGAPQTEGDTGAPQSVGDTTAANGNRDRVAQRAYELYLARGGSDGQAMDDWLIAESEIRGRADDETNRDRDS